jgi:FkbM family methyltransferase
MRNWLLLKQDTFDWGENDLDLIQIISQEIFSNKLYEKIQKVEKQDIVLDIGSNVGAFTYSVLAANPEKVICVEPSNNLINTLRKNISNKEIDVIIENSAIKSITQADIEIGHGDVIYKNIGNKINAISFKDLIKKYDLKWIDFMKVDCEFGEYDIFNEENYEFISTRVGHIAGEWHVWGLDNVLEKFQKFRDRYLTKETNFLVFDRYDNDITASIFDNSFLENYSNNYTHSAQFIIYLTNDKAKKMKNWLLKNDISQTNLSSNIRINSNIQKNKRAFVIDNFYEDPHAVRQYALQQEFFDDPGYIGRRTRTQHLFPGLKEIFESIIGEKISEWETYPMNGRFQHNWSGEPLVYHCDSQRWAAMIYLTPDAPPQTGTTMYRHRETKIHHNTQINWADGTGNRVFNQKTFLDRTPYETIDVFGNIFNRLVIFDGGCIHAASEYFGSNLYDCRLWQMFFFDGEASNIHLGA